MFTRCLEPGSLEISGAKSSHFHYHWTSPVFICLWISLNHHFLKSEGPRAHFTPNISTYYREYKTEKKKKTLKKREREGKDKKKKEEKGASGSRGGAGWYQFPRQPPVWGFADCISCNLYNHPVKSCHLAHFYRWRRDSDNFLAVTGIQTQMCLILRRIRERGREQGEKIPLGRGHSLTNAELS